MIKASLVYGHPIDTREFEKFYDEMHLPIAAKKFKEWIKLNSQSLSQRQMEARLLTIVYSGSSLLVFCKWWCNDDNRCW